MFPWGSELSGSGAAPSSTSWMFEKIADVGPGPTGTRRWPIVSIITDSASRRATVPWYGRPPAQVGAARIADVDRVAAAGNTRPLT